MKIKTSFLVIFISLSFNLHFYILGQSNLENIFYNPPEDARPWVFWYWVKAAVSKEGITADLEAMKNAGIGGAYLISVQGASNPPLYEPPAEQLSPLWWEMVNHAMMEAKRLGLQIAMHACDGFAVAGGPWITPELSMQKIVWSETFIKGPGFYNDTLPKPESYKDFYKDIAVFALPVPETYTYSTQNVIPKITTGNPEMEADFLIKPEMKQRVRCDDTCFILYEFDKPFTCRSITIKPDGNNYQSQRMLVETSNDGIHFLKTIQLDASRHGWQNTDADITYSIRPVTAKYFRFVYNPEGSEPGSEDLDAAKWKQSLKVSGIELSGMPRIHQFEGKTGSVWRVGKYSSAGEIPDTLCIPIDKIIDLSGFTNENGRLTWNAPSGNWLILRIGHTSTGHTNYIGGAALGLECDKFNPAAAELQFNNWFGKIFENVPSDITSSVLKIFHIDSWEAGSQNWSVVFRDEFKKRRGYDLYQYLPVFAGIPVENAGTSERFLQDVRQTIAELVSDNFFGTMAKLASAKGCRFSAESVAPTFTSDGMMHFAKVDIPMGEFWHNSPTHDKPSDIMDAVSAGHIYGKNMIQAEAFTTLRMAWNEHPGMLKTLGDRNYAIGVNRFVFHVFTHNPWLHRKPGMTLSDIGLFFQRDQIWWPFTHEWMQYLTRCQAMLQQGLPVTDIAVFTGEEIPRRAFTPDRLIPYLPGLFDEEILNKEEERLANQGLPLQEKPHGISNSANTYNQADWIDPLNGYKFDSFNKDVLLRLATVKDGRIVLPNGQSYGVLVIPGNGKMIPDAGFMSIETVSKIYNLVTAGATVIMCSKPDKSNGLHNCDKNSKQVNDMVQKLFKGKTVQTGNVKVHKVGKGRVIEGPYLEKTLQPIGIRPDFMVFNENGTRAERMEWMHRKDKDFDLYFVSNQSDTERIINISMQATGRVPEIFDPVSGQTYSARNWQIEDGYTTIPLKFNPNGSLFLVFQQQTNKTKRNEGFNWPEIISTDTLFCKWTVFFDTLMGGPKEKIYMDSLISWSDFDDNTIKYYSGTAVYTSNFQFDTTGMTGNNLFIDIEKVHNIAEIKVNGKSCGITWTPPYRVDITNALKDGTNKLEIHVANTWANRLMGDQFLPEEKRITWTTAPYRLGKIPLNKAGLEGKVKVIVCKK